MLINFTDPMFSNRVLGFENLVDRFERLSNESQSGYPPYNIYKDGLNFQIEVALAGIEKKDIDIELSDAVLTVKYDGPKDTDSNAEASAFESVSFGPSYLTVKTASLSSISISFFSIPARATSIWKFSPSL